MHKSRFSARISVILVLIIVLTISIPISASALSTSIGVSSTSANVGDTVSLSVYSSTSDIAGVDLYVTYDPSYLEFSSGSDACGMGPSISGGGGSIHIVGYYSGAGETGSFGVTLYFKAKQKVDGTNVYVSGDVSDTNAQGMTTDFGSGSVTIKTLSSDATLSSLSTSNGLSPSFSSSTTSYNVSVANSVTSITVSAVPNNSEASVSVSGNYDLDVGNNTVTVRVTAGDGTVKNYTITVNRAQGTTGGTTPSTSGSSPTPSVSVTPGPLNAVFKDGTELLISTFTDDQIIKGFSRTTLTYENQQIQAIQYSDKSQKLVYLIGNGAYATGFYYFDVKTGLATPIATVSSQANSYMIIDATTDMKIPSGYGKSYVVINGVNVNAYVPAGEKTPNNYIVCAVNSAGKMGLYLFDIEEGTLQRYNFSVYDPNAVVSTSATPSSSVSPTSTPVPSDNGTGLRRTIDLALYAAVAVLLIAVIILSVILVIKSRRLKYLQVGDVSFDQNTPEEFTKPKPISEDKDVKVVPPPKATDEYKFSVDDVIKEYKDKPNKDKKE